MGCFKDKAIEDNTLIQTGRLLIATQSHLGMNVSGQLIANVQAKVVDDNYETGLCDVMKGLTEDQRRDTVAAVDGLQEWWDRHQAFDAEHAAA